MKGTRQKMIVRWGLSMDGTDYFMNGKNQAVRIGKLERAKNSTTRLFEEYRFWDVVDGQSRLVKTQRNDHTPLIMSSRERLYFRNTGRLP